MPIIYIFYNTSSNIFGNSSVTENNLLGVHIHSSFSSNAPGIILNDIISESEFHTSDAETFSAQKAFENVLKLSGSSLKRDEIDTRLVEEVIKSTTTHIGLSPLNTFPYPKPGIIDSQNDTKPIDAGANWRAWPMLELGSAPLDSDNDGMPDNWEIAKSLNPKVNDSNGRHLSTAYDNIEVYLNGI